MTDPETADAVYIEPINWQTVEKIIAKERPDALLPTMGGQTALNCALDLADHGVLEKYGVELIGASRDAIRMAEDRELFRHAMMDIGLDCPKAEVARSFEQALEIQTKVGYPTIIRPSFTLGGSGGGIAYNVEEFEEIVDRGLELSPVHEVLIEESVLGWKEFEMEVVRDKADNCIIVCSIENFDPMGVHTGDSITVAPAQTLTDKEYQRLRDASIAVLRKIGVDTGGSNVQFGVNSENGRVVVIEMNPRVSRSSALASKATGFPDRESRGEARGRLHARRTPQRNHRRQDAGVVRADDRLRRHQDSALRVREISVDRFAPDDADEIGRRSHGDRSHVPGIAAEGVARPRDGQERAESAAARYGDAGWACRAQARIARTGP